MNWMEHELTKGPLIKPERKDMKEICKNCGNCRPTYKGGYCEVKHKKTKTTGTCEEWRPKR